MAENAVKDYGWTSEVKPFSCDYIGPAVLKILKSLDVLRVVDIGSGNGILCAEMAANGFKPVGVEYDAAGVAIAQSQYPNINFYQFGVQDDPKKLLSTEAPFDAVVSTEVIEHLFSPHLLPIFAAGLLKPGGKLVITTPYHGYLKNLALSIFNAWDNHLTAQWHGGHIKFWSRKTLTQLLKNNGFEVQAFSGVGRFPYLWKSMILVAKKK